MTRRKEMLIYGISDGAVIQRGDDDTCNIVIEGNFNGAPESSLGRLDKIDDDRYLLTGIPVGGPYEFGISDNEEQLVYKDIYVGDVWLLAGQSNMEGAGRMRQKDYESDSSPIPEIRALYMDYKWRPVRTQLHQLWLSPDPAHMRAFRADKENHDKSDIKACDFYPAEQKRGVGPGSFFARSMYVKTSVPQGVIPAAVGGAPIEMWIPPADDTDNYYTAALSRVRCCGSNIKGIFWYQGEGYSGDLDEYDRMFESMRRGIASVCRRENLPAVQVQTFRCLLPWASESMESAYSWSRFRAHQTDMARSLPDLRTIASNDLELDDLIHLSASSHEILGRRAAEAMLGLINGYETEPAFDSVTLLPDIIVPSWYVLNIKYNNVGGGLISAGVPSGFMLSEPDKAPAMTWMQHTSLIGDTVQIRTELTAEQLRRMSLWYGFGHGFYCNITDKHGHALPSLGPIGLKNA